MTDPQAPPSFPKTSDLKCLRCGAMNIIDNKICGACGASLPVVYDEEGHMVRLEASSYRTTDLLPRYQSSKPKTGRARLIVRLLILLFAFFGALWIAAHRR